MRFIMLTLITTIALGQTYDVAIKGTKKGHQYLDKPMPAGIKLVSMDKKNYELAVDELTLVQVWSTCCGSEPEIWAKMREMELTYVSKGLRTVSINIENGQTGREQYKAVKQYLEMAMAPNEVYLDLLGYTVDDLGARSLPTYILIDQTGNMVFKTSGKDVDGVMLLEMEIEKRLEK